MPYNACTLCESSLYQQATNTIEAIFPCAHCVCVFLLIAVGVNLFIAPPLRSQGIQKQVEHFKADVQRRMREESRVRQAQLDAAYERGVADLSSILWMQNRVLQSMEELQRSQLVRVRAIESAAAAPPSVCDYKFRDDKGCWFWLCLGLGVYLLSPEIHNPMANLLLSIGLVPITLLLVTRDYHHSMSEEKSNLSSIILQSAVRR